MMSGALRSLHVYICNGHMAALCSLHPLPSLECPQLRLTDRLHRLAA